MIKRAVLACAFAAGSVGAAVDVDALWNFNDPAASEARFREALINASGDDALILHTQIARTLGLRKRYDESHRELDAIDPALAAAGVEPRVRAWRRAMKSWRSKPKRAPRNCAGSSHQRRSAANTTTPAQASQAYAISSSGPRCV